MRDSSSHLPPTNPPFLLLPAGPLYPTCSHCTLWAPGCAATCSGLELQGCEDKGRCHEGCVCNAGSVLNGAACVPASQCSALAPAITLKPAHICCPFTQRPLLLPPPSWRPGGLQTLQHSPGQPRPLPRRTLDSTWLPPPGCLHMAQAASGMCGPSRWCWRAGERPTYA